MSNASPPIELLSTAEMARVDRAAIAMGTPGLVLMDRAGSAVADQCRRLLAGHPDPSVFVLCGPGNNGGDGFVAARRLQASGFRVCLALLGAREALSGDAAEAARGWTGPIEAAAATDCAGADLIVDALFGAGLTRPLEGVAANLVEQVNALGVPVLAVDVPSGVDGTTGAASGPTIHARTTVTFFRLKPGHLLQPGRSRCGEIVLADIGIDPAVLAEIGSTVFANHPGLWRSAYPWPTVEGHKYTRGHAVVLSGGATTTGAARMSARAALRVGAGLVTLASPSAALAVNAAHLTAIMLRACDDRDDLAALLNDARKNVVVLGPGLGVGPETRAMVEQALAPGDSEDSPRAVVLDADALMSFAGDFAGLAALIAKAPGLVVVTPHEGEFSRLFALDGKPAGSRLDRARAGAEKLGAVMLLKGPDTVVVEPGGRASIADFDAPWLATAGSGDVLSGLVGGLLAQGMPPFEAASAAVYLHARTANQVGFGLIAEDLPEHLPAALAALHAEIG